MRFLRIEACGEQTLWPEWQGLEVPEEHLLTPGRPGQLGPHRPLSGDGSRLTGTRPIQDQGQLSIHHCPSGLAWAWPSHSTAADAPPL